MSHSDITTRQVDNAIWLREYGQSQKEIAQGLGVDASTLRRMIKKRKLAIEEGLRTTAHVSSIDKGEG